MSKLLVMGIGNMLLSDEGVGVFAAQELMKENLPENVTVVEAGTFTHDVFYMFEGYDAVLILDVLHAGGKVGDIYRLDESALVDNEKQRLSLHDIDLIDSLRMAELLYGKKPSLVVVGIEPYDYTTWNVGLTPVLQERFAAYMDAARKEIAAITAAQN